MLTYERGYTTATYESPAWARSHTAPSNLPHRAQSVGLGGPSHTASRDVSLPKIQHILPALAVSPGKYAEVSRTERSVQVQELRGYQ